MERTNVGVWEVLDVLTCTDETFPSDGDTDGASAFDSEVVTQLAGGVWILEEARGDGGAIWRSANAINSGCCRVDLCRADHGSGGLHRCQRDGVRGLFGVSRSELLRNGKTDCASDCIGREEEEDELEEDEDDVGITKAANAQTPKKQR